MSGRSLDLDGMTLMRPIQAVPAVGTSLGTSLGLETVEDVPQEDDMDDLPWGNDLAMSALVPMMVEVIILVLCID